MRIFKRKWFVVYLSMLLLVLAAFWFSIPSPLFSDPTCTVITDSKGELLDATIAKDGQYRFPEADSIPRKFSSCIVTFEDKHFYTHPGINPFYH